MATPCILVVEDDEALGTLLHYNFEREGFRVTVVADGEEAMIRAQEELPDFVLLDWMLPKLSGIEVCRQLRSQPATRNVPIIMMTARSEEADAVRGLDMGADDYVTKPISVAELTARVRAILRRVRPGLNEDVVRHHDISLDRVAHRVRRGSREIHLGPTEFRLLAHFMSNPRRVFSRQQLLDAVWGADIFVEARTVDVHVGRLRRALIENGEHDLIRTVRAAGYSLDGDS